MYETENLTRLATSLQFTVKKLKLGYNRINTVFGRFDDSRCCDQYANLYHNLQKKIPLKKKKERLFCARIRGNEKEKYIFKKTQRISDNHDICRISSSKRPGTYLKFRLWKDESLTDGGAQSRESLITKLLTCTDSVDLIIFFSPSFLVLDLRIWPKRVNDSNSRRWSCPHSA